MWNIVWVSPQGHRSVSVSRHFLLKAPQCPCSMRKRFSRDHCCRGRLKPGCRIVGSHTRWELTTWADFQLCLHRLLMSTGWHQNSGFLDVSRSNGGLRISGWISKNWCNCPCAPWNVDLEAADSPVGWTNMACFYSALIIPYTRCRKGTRRLLNSKLY